MRLLSRWLPANAYLKIPGESRGMKIVVQMPSLLGELDGGALARNDGGGGVDEGL